jgi:hypothetical protein
MRYLHYAPHAEDTAVVAEAFRVDSVPASSPELS